MFIVLQVLGRHESVPTLTHFTLWGHEYNDCPSAVAPGVYSCYPEHQIEVDPKFLNGTWFCNDFLTFRWQLMSPATSCLGRKLLWLLLPRHCCSKWLVTSVVPWKSQGQMWHGTVCVHSHRPFSSALCFYIDGYMEGWLSPWSWKDTEPSNLAHMLRVCS